MKKMKASFAVASIQCVDATLSNREQMRIGRCLFRGGVRKIAEQSEISVFILVREVMDLESFNQFVNLRLVQKNRWYNDECCLRPQGFR